MAGRSRCRSVGALGPPVRTASDCDSCQPHVGRYRHEGRGPSGARLRDYWARRRGLWRFLQGRGNWPRPFSALHPLSRGALTRGYYQQRHIQACRQHSQVCLMAPRSELSPLDTAIGAVLLGEPVVGFLEVAIAQEPLVRAERRRVLIHAESNTSPTVS